MNPGKINLNRINNSLQITISLSEGFKQSNPFYRPSSGKIKSAMDFVLCVITNNNCFKKENIL